ncbi:hypothetical protein CISIN_1g0379741mg, partial [Citrus sinensis]
MAARPGIILFPAFVRTLLLDIFWLNELFASIPQYTGNETI